MNNNRIAVTTSNAEKQPEAERLAAHLGLPYITAANTTAYEYLLVFTSDYLVIQDTRAKHGKPFYIDFTSGKLLYRSQQAGLRKELIARAIGFKPAQEPHIIDATAGLGRDSFILATLGFKVTMLERSPILFALLNDALLRGKQNSTTAPIVERLQLIEADAITWLPLTQDRPHVIYLDPMFPERQKSALVKKEMVILQDLLGKDSDCETLLKVALACTTKRVVVKRPRLAKSLGTENSNLTPNFSVTGKNSRFDIYLA